MFYLYILNSEKIGRYYVGVTADLAQRIRNHNAGKVKSTKGYRPWKSLYFEKYLSLGEAREREAQIKAWKSRDAIQRLAKHFRI